jgi:hypothetical protein
VFFLGCAFCFFLTNKVFSGGGFSPTYESQIKSYLLRDSGPDFPRDPDPDPGSGSGTRIPVPDPGTRFEP